MMFDQGKLTEMFIILFDDMLLVTRKKKGLSKKVKSTDTFPIYTICPGNALERVQRVQEPADVWDITFCTRRF